MSFKQLFQCSPVPLLVLDMESWRPLEFNDRAAEFMGYTREEFGRLNISDFEVQPNPAETREHIRDIRRARQDSFTAVHKKRMGEQVRVRVDLSVVNWLGREAMMTVWQDLGRLLGLETASLTRRKGNQQHQSPRIVARSEGMQRVLRLAERVARTDLPVLLLGESGTGKELVARQIHALSDRVEQVFMPINCGALPPDIVDGELFGARRGAFTGADRSRQGRLEVANGGTVFLDEVAELTLPVQARLLRALQNGEIHQLGAANPKVLDIRIVAATNRDLGKMVEEGTFREDLYFRIAGMVIKIPPLRSRIEDIRGLIHLEIDQSFGSDSNRPVEFSESDLAHLESLPWKGNARELLSLVRRAIALSDDGRPFFGLDDEPSLTGPLAGPPVRLDEAIRSHLIATLEATCWKIEGPSGAASRLGIRPSTLRSQMAKHGIKRP